MEEWLYWIFEYGKVFLGYMFIMLIWPSAMFRKYLKGKSMTFRLGFCVCMQLVVVNTVVLMLGLFNILNVWTMRLVFFGALIWSFREKLMPTKERKKRFRYLITGTLGWKQFLFKCRQWIKNTAGKVWTCFWSFYRVHWLEYTILLIAVVYGLIYFSYGLFLEQSYPFSDTYVHHSWVYQLAQGVPFSSGIYPEGMHCMMYSLYALFGVRIYSCMLFVPSVNVIFVLLSIYCMMKELFKWRYSALFALIVFLTIDVAGGHLTVSMARVQAALPQEFAFPAIYFCMAFLLRYLKNRRHMVRKGKESKGYWDENLLVFSLAVACTILVHFYATFMALFLCIAVITCWFKKIFSRKRFLPLATAAMCGLFIAILPMIVGIMSGIRLQGSLYWGLSILDIDLNKEDDATEESTEENSPEEESSQEENLTLSDGTRVLLQASTGGVQIDEDAVRYDIVGGQNVQQRQRSSIEKAVDRVSGLWQSLQDKAKLLRDVCYQGMYGAERSGVLAWMTAFTFLFWLGYRALALVMRLVFRKPKVDRNRYDTYPVIALASVIFAITYSPQIFGFPKILDGSRTGFTNHLMAMMVLMVPLDIVFDWIRNGMNKIGATLVTPFLSVCVIFILLITIICTGNYHGYLYSEVTRYDSVVEVTNRIIAELPENSYTIISPTEELYQVIEYGRHEELADFCIKQKQNQVYTIPTEYVFLFVEKRPLQSPHYHFYDGPAWLAMDKYQYQYASYSQWPEYSHSEISEEMAEREMMEFTSASAAYLSLESRTILQSKAYKWCERFNELYPYELKTYYEDDNFVCYYWKQNLQYLYDLVIE